MRDPLRADYRSFALPAYERDNQRQDEAEGDPGNRQEPHEPGPQEADPEAEADVSFLRWSPGLVTHQAGRRKMWLLAPDVLSHPTEEDILHNRVRTKHKCLTANHEVGCCGDPSRNQSQQRPEQPRD